MLFVERRRGEIFHSFQYSKYILLMDSTSIYIYTRHKLMLRVGEGGQPEKTTVFLPCHILAVLSSGSHEPQPFSLPCPILAILSSGSMSHKRSVLHATTFLSSGNYKWERMYEKITELFKLVFALVLSCHYYIFYFGQLPIPNYITV